MQSCCFGFEQHRGRWAVFSAAFHHAERAPRVISSLTAESPTIRSFKTSFGPDIGSLTTRVLRARKTRKWSSSLLASLRRRGNLALGPNVEAAKRQPRLEEDINQASATM